jgi:hypothetical protein
MKFCGGSVLIEVAKAEMAEYIKRSSNKQVADGFGGQDQAPPDCGNVTPERVERRFLVAPVFQARKCRLVGPRAPGHLGQGESRRLAGALDLLDKRAQLAILAVEVEVRPLAAGNQLLGSGAQVSEHFSDGSVASPVFGSPLDLGAIISMCLLPARPAPARIQKAEGSDVDS